MNDEQTPTPDENEDANEGANEGENETPDPNSPQTQQVQHSHVSALVPEKVARGVFSTGAVVLNGPHEFIVDFLLRMTKPHQVAARVVLPPAVMPRFIAALRQNIENYKKQFGEPQLPRIPENLKQVQQPSAQELYEQLKFADADMGGTYANAVMIGHTATEFSFDFITTFFPRSVVSSRVYLSAPNVPRFLDSLNHSFEQYRRKAESQQPPQPPWEPRAPEPPQPPEET